MVPYTLNKWRTMPECKLYHFDVDYFLMLKCSILDTIRQDILSDSIWFFLQTEAKPTVKEESVVVQNFGILGESWKKKPFLW